MTDQGKQKKNGIGPIAAIAIGVLAISGLGALGGSDTNPTEVPSTGTTESVNTSIQPQSKIPGTVNPLPAAETPDPVVVKQEKKTEAPHKTTKEEKPVMVQEKTAEPEEEESTCHPSYSGCLDKNTSDYDCAGGSGNGPKYTGPVRVIGSDVFDLDRDHDGMACE